MAKKPTGGKRGRPPGKKSAPKKTGKPKPGRKPKAIEQSARVSDGADTKGSTQSAVMIPKAALTKLLKDCDAMARQASSTTGSIREAIGNAKEKHGLHPGAFGVVRRLHKIGQSDPRALAIFLDHFDYMCEATGLDAIADSAPELDLGAPADDAEDDAGGQKPGGKLDLGEPEEEETEEHAAPQNVLRMVPLGQN